MSEQGFKRFRRRRALAVEHASDRGAPNGAPSFEQVPARDQSGTPASVKQEAQARPVPTDEPSISADPPAPPSASIAAAPILTTPPVALPEPWDQIRQVSFAGSGSPGASDRSLRLVCNQRESAAAKSFDLLRTRLLHTLKDRGWRRVAVTAPLSGCGTTFSAVNLALSLARVPGRRTILMDMNFRHPGVAAAMGLATPTGSGENGGLASFLSGATRMEEQLVRPLPSLAVGANDVPDQNAAELLHGANCAAAIDEMMQSSGAHTALFDLPPVLEHDDTVAFLPQVDAVLLISDGTATTAAHLAACEKMLAGHTQLLGVVLNRAQRSEMPLD